MSLEKWADKDQGVEKSPKSSGLNIEDKTMASELFDGEVENKQLQRELEVEKAKTLTDELTGLLNKRGLNEELKKVSVQIGRRKKPAAVLMIDLNGFKAVNDNLGHEAGDEILKRMAKVMEDLVRKGDDTVSRPGGDEFVIVLTDPENGMTEERAKKVGWRLNKMIKAEFAQDEEQEKKGLSASVGVSLIEGRDETKLALERADEAMYEAKKNKEGENLDELVKSWRDILEEKKSGLE